MKLSFRVLFLFIFLQKRNIRTTNGLVNKAFNKTTFQSGTLQWPQNIALAKWSSAHAVDGRKVCPSPSTWREYSGTDSLLTPWWQVDLGEVIKIERVVVYGQPQESPPQLKGFRIYITMGNITRNENIAYENNENYGKGVFDVIISHTHQRGRYVTVDLPMTPFSQRKEHGPLVLCEIEVFSQACVKGNYGNNCAYECSDHCLDGKFHCDTRTGHCERGCTEGLGIILDLKKGQGGTKTGQGADCS